MTNLISKGKIDGKDVIYKEGCFHGPWDNLQGWDKQNIMEIKFKDTDGKIIELKFREWMDVTYINYLSENTPNFQKDKLGEVVINVEGKKKVYKERDIDDSTLEGKHTQTVFEKANKTYNELRTKIREELKQAYSQKTKTLENIL